MFCSKCGAQMEEGDICPKCGMPYATPRPRVVQIERKESSSYTQSSKQESHTTGCLTTVIVIAIIASIIYGISHQEEAVVQNSGGNTQMETSVSSKYKFEIISTHLDVDEYTNEPIMIVEYNFTNNSDDAISFSWACIDTAYQNGVSKNSVVWSNKVDAQQQLNDVKSGATYKLKVAYALLDNKTSVNLEVREPIINKLLLSKIIELK